MIYTILGSLLFFELGRGVSPPKSSLGKSLDYLNKILCNVHSLLIKSAYWVIFLYYFVVFFFQNQLFQKFHFVGTGLGPNCLQGYQQMIREGKGLVKEQFELLDG